MSKATLTSKGQLTVPKDVRDRLGLTAGARLSFEVEGDSLRITVERRKSLEELKGSLPDRRGYEDKEAEREAARRLVSRRALEKGE